MEDFSGRCWKKKKAVYQVKCTLGSKRFSAGTQRTEKKAKRWIKNSDREAKGRDMTKVTHLCDFRELFHRLLVEPPNTNFFT